MEDSVWYSPFSFIYHGDKLKIELSTEEKKTKKFRKVVEAVSVAQMLVGMIALEDKEYWMQIVDDKNGTPDIKTIKYADQHSKKFDNLEQIDVEVVEYGVHSKESIPKFIVKSKFSDNKSYDENTVILCHIGKTTAFIPNFEEIEKQFENVSSACQVILLAATNPSRSEFVLVELRPKIGLLIEFDINDVFKKRKYRWVVNFKKGIRGVPEYHLDDRHYPFEKLGYIPNSEGKY